MSIARPSPMTALAFPLTEEWVLQRLPLLNREILVGNAAPGLLMDELVRGPLRTAPPVATLSAEQARQWVVYLGLFGSSVARHLQERDPVYRQAPARCFEGLHTGDGTAFLAYMGQIAKHTKLHHPPRDSYASLVRWNAPTVQVTWQGIRYGTLPGVFASDAIRTYTRSPEEELFIELLKKAEALEQVVNALLLPLLTCTLSLTGDEARSRLLLCATLLMAVHQINLKFTAREADGRPVFTAAHFMDVLRQFAVHWSAEDVPPSGAQDPEFLMRDLHLGTTTPDYSRHVRRVFPALLGDEQEAIGRAEHLPSLPALVHARLGSQGIQALSTLSPAALVALAGEQPWLVPIYEVLRAHGRVSASHLMLTKSFLFKPARQREDKGSPDAILVSNHAGTTGLIEQQLERFHQARAGHALAMFDRAPRERLLHAAAIPSGSHAPHDLMQIAHFTSAPGATA